MKLYNISIVLFICSLLLFVPVFRADVKIELFPFTTQNVLVNINNPSITLESNIDESISLNITQFDEVTKLQKLIWRGEINGELRLKMVDSGYFYFSFVSEKLAKIVIHANGINNSSIIISSILFAALAVMKYLQRFQEEPTYFTK